MASLPDILTRARATMTHYPALWMPPVLINIFQMLAGTPMVSPVAQVAVGVTTYMAAFLIMAGWLAMIGPALAGKAPTMADFQGGINTRWGAMMAGHLAFLAGLGLAGAGLVLVGDRTYGADPLIAWYNTLQHLTPEAMQAALQPARIPTAVRGWMNLMVAGLAVAAAWTFLLLFWQPLVVLAGMPWYRAWSASVRLVFARFRLAFSLAFMHGVIFFASLSVAASGNVLFTLVGLTMLLFVSIFFKIAYAAVVVDACDLAAPTPSPVSETDTPRP